MNTCRKVPLQVIFLDDDILFWCLYIYLVYGRKIYSMNRNWAVPGARPAPVQLRILKSAQDPLQASSCPDIRAGPFPSKLYIFPNKYMYLISADTIQIQRKTSSFSPCDLPWGGRSAAQDCCSRCSDQLIGPATGRRRWQQTSGTGC